MELRTGLWKIIDWIYPPTCVYCGERGALVCDECFKDAEEVGKPYCIRCGKPLLPHRKCSTCAKAEFEFTACRAPYLYEGVIAEVIKKLKFNHSLELSEWIGERLSSFYQTLSWDIDLMVPVPLSKEGRRSRGFNQSEWIAKAFARKVGLEVAPNALIKVRHTETQVGLSGEQRRDNLRGAFVAEPVLVRGKRILLIDDVMTTGSTFNECTIALLEAGARNVRCLSLATRDYSRASNKSTDEAGMPDPP